MRIEGLAGRVDFLEAVVGERGFQLGEDHLDAFDDAFGVGGLLGGGEAVGEVVDDGQQVFEYAAGGKLAQLVFLSEGAFAEVFEVGDGAQVARIVVGGLFLGGVESFLRRCLGDLLGVGGGSRLAGLGGWRGGGRFVLFGFAHVRRSTKGRHGD